MTGKEVTIQFSSSPPTQTPLQAIFFTRPWLYGDSIAVLEIGRQDVAEDQAGDEDAGTRQEITEVVDRKPDTALQGRLAEAQAVVTGRVINTRPSHGLGQRVTEHDPGLQVAVVAIESVEMGDLSQPTVDVLFAASNDVMWFRSPKLLVGREGIWLLHRGGLSGAAAVPAAAWTCLDPGDELPKDQIDRVRGNVDAIGRGP